MHGSEFPMIFCIFLATSLYLWFCQHWRLLSKWNPLTLFELVEWSVQPAGDFISLYLFNSRTHKQKVSLFKLTPSPCIAWETFMIFLYLDNSCLSLHVFPGFVFFLQVKPNLFVTSCTVCGELCPWTRWMLGSGLTCATPCVVYDMVFSLVFVKICQLCWTIVLSNNLI